MVLQSKNVLRTRFARILAPINKMNPSIAKNGASHVILPMPALHDDFVAGKIATMDAHREIFVEHVAFPLCAIDCDLDPQEFDIEVCEQFWWCSWLDAT